MIPRPLLIPLAVSCLTLAAACADPCPEGNPGASDVDYDVGGGHAAGLWQVTLDPVVAESDCADARQVATETYAYTLEFRQSSGDEVQAHLLVDGFLFVDSGTFDEASGMLSYTTGIREDSEREGGAVSYRITGNAALQEEGEALTWTGFEEIKVVESQDPNAPAGCVFVFDTYGSKTCDE